MQFKTLFFIILSVIVFELFIVFFIIHTDSVKSDTVNNSDTENLFYNYQDTSASESIDITPTASCSETSGQKYDDIYVKDCYENRIALTFDDGPGGACTERLLDGLRKRNVKATFFLIGENAAEYPDIVKRMHEEGHIIGNHTFSHIQLSSVNIDTAYAEIVKTNEIISDITSCCPIYIRPPYGSYSDKLLAKINMTPVLWTIDPKDWDTTNVSSIVNTVVKDADCGDIILLHDIYDSSVTAALEIIDELQARGFVFVTIDQIILE